MTKVIILKLITYYSLVYNINPSISIAVAQQESAFNPSVIGSTGDVGLFQLRPASFPNYTIKQLQDPRLNIELGVKYLVKMKHECKHQNNNEWLVCFNYGPTNAMKVKHPGLWPYTKQINKIIALNY